MTEPLAKVDSAVQGLENKITSPVKEKRRASSYAEGVMNIEELKTNRTPIEVAIETQRTGWKINTSSSTVEEKEILSKHLTEPPVKRIDLMTSLGMKITARSMKGVTIKDALDAIHKANKKRSDDELEKPYLEGFEWAANNPPAYLTKDEEIEKYKDEEWTVLHIRLQSTPTVSSSSGGGKKKKNKKHDDA
ncbi:uncharacterized protein PG998_005126 [Apiospora kogelbergensis]|uniref:Uncharacterized protein n=1 Tax=Apiospora kogelbergensis TaxID=1337665 RepID=A0AAW0QJ26_9PEZI